MVFKSSIAEDSMGDDYIASCINRYSNNPSDVVIILDPEDINNNDIEAWEYIHAASLNSVCLDIYLSYDTEFSIFVILENWDASTDPHPSFLKIQESNLTNPYILGHHLTGAVPKLGYYSLF